VTKVGNSFTSEFRKTINADSIGYEVLADYGYDKGKELLVPESTVKGVLDTIEDSVNELVNLLEDIEGLTEIDRVKEKLKTLSYKLY
jgi:hypothetical protein